MSYWYCLKHGRVETEVGCAHADRLGPFETMEQATNALELVRQRNESWKEEDQRWESDN